VKVLRAVLVSERSVAVCARAGSSINAIISILFDGENISCDASLVMYINSTTIPPIIIMNKMYENQNLLYIVPLIRHTIVVWISSISPTARGCFICSIDVFIVVCNLSDNCFRYKRIIIIIIIFINCNWVINQNKPDLKQKTL
jgi:hypothetical protein